MAQDGADLAQLLAKELKILKDQRMVVKGNIRRRYMALLRDETDLDRYTSVEDERNKELKVVDASFDAKERALKEKNSRASSQVSEVRIKQEEQAAPAYSSPPRSCYSQHSAASASASASASAPASVSAPARVPASAPPSSNKLPSQDTPASPKAVAQVPSVEVRSLFADGRHRLMVTFDFRRLPQNQKHRASAEPAALGEPKRPRLENVDQAQGETEQERTITYGEVRRRAKEDGWWDTIIDFPSGSQKWYVLYCEEHGINFKQGAANAAAKHLNGAFHGFPTRNQKVAVKELGYRIVDCTMSLAKEHNSEVDNAFRNGYVPRNSLQHGKYERKVKYPFEDTDTRTEGKEPNDSKRGVSPEPPLTSFAHTPPRKACNKSKAKIIDPPLPAKKKFIADPKTFHIYYCEFLEGEYENGKTRTSIWPVVILGWDDLQPGAMRVEKLVDTGLLDQDAQPPGCYVYSDRKDKILGWKMGTDDKPRHRANQRKFPVMFFDDDYSYAWASATELSKFPLDRKNAPKVRGYREKAFNEARDFIARREGYRCWADREAAKAAGQLKKWYPGMPRDESLPPVWPVQDREGGSPSPRPAHAARKLAASPDIPYAPPDLPKLQAESSSAFELRPGAQQKFTAKRTKRHQQRDSASTADSYQFAMTPAETPTLIETPESPRTTLPGTAIPAAAIDPSAVPIFELSQYWGDDNTYWSRSSAEVDGIKLYEAGSNGSVLRSSQGSAIEVEIDAADWECLDFKGVPGDTHVAGNTQITLRRENKSIQIMFDRKQGDVKTAKGKIQARNFVEWLREKRKQIGLELRTETH